MFKKVTLIIYIFFISSLAIVTSNKNYLYSLFLNNHVNISMIIDVLATYFIKYNVIVIIFLVWLSNYSSIEVLSIVRSKNVALFTFRSILNHFRYIFYYYLFYLIIISVFLNNEYGINYGIKFLISSNTNALILFLVLIIFELTFRIKNNYIVYIISVFMLIVSTDTIYKNKLLGFFYELINNSNYTQINTAYYIKSIIVIIILILIIKKILKKIDIF